MKLSIPKPASLLSKRQRRRSTSGGIRSGGHHRGMVMLMTSVVLCLGTLLIMLVNLSAHLWLHHDDQEEITNHHEHARPLSPPARRESARRRPAQQHDRQQHQATNTTASSCDDAYALPPRWAVSYVLPHVNVHDPATYRGALYAVYVNTFCMRFGCGYNSTGAGAAGAGGGSTADVIVWIESSNVLPESDLRTCQQLNIQVRYLAPPTMSFVDAVTRKFRTSLALVQYDRVLVLEPHVLVRDNVDYVLLASYCGHNAWQPHVMWAGRTSPALPSLFVVAPPLPPPPPTTDHVAATDSVTTTTAAAVTTTTESPAAVRQLQQAIFRTLTRLAALPHYEHHTWDARIGWGRRHNKYYLLNDTNIHTGWQWNGVREVSGVLYYYMSQQQQYSVVMNDHVIHYDGDKITWQLLTAAWPDQAIITPKPCWRSQAKYRDCRAPFFDFWTFDVPPWWQAAPSFNAGGNGGGGDGGGGGGGALQLWYRVLQQLTRQYNLPPLPPAPSFQQSGYHPPASTIDLTLHEAVLQLRSQKSMVAAAATAAAAVASVPQPA